MKAQYLGLLLVSVAYAIEWSQCAQDVHKYCPEISDSGAVRECMSCYVLDLSDECYSSLEDQDPEYLSLGCDTCDYDINRVCHGITEYDELHMCLTCNHLKLSLQCWEKLDSDPTFFDLECDQPTDSTFRRSKLRQFKVRSLAH